MRGQRYSCRNNIAERSTGWGLHCTKAQHCTAQHSTSLPHIDHTNSRVRPTTSWLTHSMITTCGSYFALTVLPCAFAAGSGSIPCASGQGALQSLPESRAHPGSTGALTSESRGRACRLAIAPVGRVCGVHCWVTRCVWEVGAVPRPDAPPLPPSASPHHQAVPGLPPLSQASRCCYHAGARAFVQTSFWGVAPSCRLERCRPRPWQACQTSVTRCHAEPSCRFPWAARLSAPPAPCSPQASPFAAQGGTGAHPGPDSARLALPCLCGCGPVVRRWESLAACPVAAHRGQQSLCRRASTTCRRVRLALHVPWAPAQTRRIAMTHRCSTLADRPWSSECCCRAVARSARECL